MHHRQKESARTRKLEIILYFCELMKKTLPILICLGLGLSIFVAGCEENDLEVSGAEPFFKVKFINQDSLTQLNSYINLVNGQIKSVDDSLNVIEEREENGDETDYTEEINALNMQKDSLDRQKLLFNNVIETINSGKVQVNRLSAEGGVGEITFSDSLTMFQFPLNSSADISRFFITIGNETDTLTVTYSREIVVEERIVLVNAYNFNIPDHTFDDIKISQSDSTNYSSNEATAILSF